MSSTTYLFNIENINEALVKETIKEEEVAKVKDNQKIDLNCYNNSSR